MNMVKEDFEKWGKLFSGCHGGNIGNAKERSVWVCGLEFGGQYNNLSEIEHEFRRKVSDIPTGYCSEYGNLASPYDRNVLKIITAMCGEEIKNYLDFNAAVRPFVKGSPVKLFKMNLFPLAFSRLNDNLWSECYKEATGFICKDDYKKWCEINRFDFINNLVKKHRPFLIICFGAEDYHQSFLNAFLKKEYKKLDDKSNNSLSWYIKEGYKNENIKLVICPSPSFNSSNQKLESIGKEIKDKTGGFVICQSL